MDLLNPHRQTLKHVTHPVLGRCVHIKQNSKETVNFGTFDNLNFHPFIPSLVEGSSEVCVSSAEEALALYETGRKTPGADTSSIYSWWVKGSPTLSSLTCLFNHSSGSQQKYSNERRQPSNKRLNDPRLVLLLNVLFLQLQFHVLVVCGVETPSRRGGVGGLPQQTAAVQPGRSSQQGRPQRVSREPAFSSRSEK